MSLHKKENDRLSSLGQPRDFNLRGPKPKRVYIPNIKAIRNKGKIVPSQSSDGNRKHAGRKQRERKNGAEKSDRYIQSSGIFSEGTNCESKRSTLNADKASDARDASEAISGMEKPKLDVNATWDIDLNEEAGVINDLLNLNTNEDDELKVEKNEYQPLVLPLERNVEDYFKIHAPGKGKELKIKAESTQILANTMMEDNDNDIDEYLKRSSLLTPKLFNDDHLALSLIQLPNSMPGHGYDDDENIINFSLDQMMDGRIGKLVKRKSGKMELYIGDTAYSLNSIESTPFSEEIISLPDSDTELEERRRPIVTRIGKLKEKFMIAPAWPSLLPSDDDFSFTPSQSGSTTTTTTLSDLS